MGTVGICCSSEMLFCTNLGYLCFIISLQNNCTEPELCKSVRETPELSNTKSFVGLIIRNIVIIVGS